MTKLKLTIPGVKEEMEMELKKGRYSNGRLALELIHLKSMEPWCRLTVNLPEFPLKDDEILIKGWSENKETVKALMEQTDIFISDGQTVSSGFVKAYIWKFTDPTIVDRLKWL